MNTQISLTKISIGIVAISASLSACRVGGGLLSEVSTPPEDDATQTTGETSAPATAPTQITYTYRKAVWGKDIAVWNNSPTITGGTPTSYSISPSLPTGLEINATTGVISGTPSAAAVAADYTITATNSAGTVQATINFSVLNKGHLVTTNDTAGTDATQGDGVCETAASNGICTIRAAIEELDGNEDGVILVPNNTYSLASVFPTMSSNSITIMGQSQGSVVIEGTSTAVDFFVTNGDDETFSIHHATLRTGDRGISSNGSNLELSHLTMESFDNRALDSGGTVTGNLDRCSFLDNSTSVFGAAMFVGSSGNFTITNSYFFENRTSSSATCGGAAICANNPTMVIRQSTFEGNRSTAYDGGAIYFNSGPSLTLENNTFVTNDSSGDGGAIFTRAPTTLTNNTFYNNSTPSGSGDAIASDVSSKNLRNNIFSGTDDNCDGGGTWTSDGYNISGTAQADCNTNGTGDQNDVTSNLNLSTTLADNGGPTKTLAISTGSVAIDNGDPNNCPATDQRGETRTAATCDVGAFEL